MTPSDRRAPDDADDAPELPRQDFVECVTAYLEGALDPLDTLRLDVHLRECDSCALYLDQLRATGAAVGRVRPEALPDTARAELMRAFDAWAGGRSTPS